MSLNIEMSKDGYRVLRIDKNDKKVYLGSKYDQKREIEKFINKFKEFTNKDNFVIVGLSFTEHIKELLKLINENSKILIVEFNNELIEYCKNDEDIKKIIDSDKVIIANNKDEIDNFIITYINEMNVERLKVEEYSGYEKIYYEELQVIYTLIRNSIARIKLNRNTYRVFGEKFLSNMLSNFKYIAKANDINILQDVYKDKPAIIVSAGPSLINNIDQIKGLNNFLILSGGRTLGALLERNINPSCLGVVDPGEVSYKLVEQYIKKINCPLIFNDLTNEKVVEAHPSGKFFYTDNEFISEIWGKKIETMYGGGSIAHALTNLAVYMGCNPIIFIGQDLAYTGENGHASCCGNRWDELTFDQYKDQTDIYVKDIHGDLVRTSLILNDYRVSLETIIKKNPSVEFINATEGGAFIEGTKTRILKDVLKELKEEKIIPMENFLSNVNKIDDIIKKLQDNLKMFEKDIKLCKKAKMLLKDYKTNYYLNNHKMVDKIIKQIDEIDNEIIRRNTKIDLLTTVMTKIIFDVENDEEFIVKCSDSKNRVFNKEVNRSQTLYSEIERIVDECYKRVEETITELKGMC